MAEEQFPEEQNAATRGGKARKEVFEWVKALAIAAILVWLIRWFLFAPFAVDGPSMQPNFHTGERLIVNKIIFDIRQPHRGEVVVFHVPQEGRDFIKRVIALPGDKVKVEGDDVFVNDVKQDEPYLKQAIEEANKKGELWNQSGPNFPNENVTEGTVPADSFLAMGDNRSNSEDSRRIGYIPYKQLIGRADVIFWPPSDMKIIKHG
ncbi:MULTISPECIES: signal peptidase I [unclassified Paenibacillus]|uniref:signal peptidase I n=1 Tax=unclassified Paenibacillus TaxID=185978 RepID=UPI0009541CB1|nr:MULTISPECIES: signal peptidase I [unclassified Paenibacillus]ASS65737.1 signal peptidase I [Paenibacillus sp. RUD330]SIQ25839.1 signal peptidase I [Paenibacillus sp. RU4X]SIQ47597.1 signal peptidase I [Paenibacillus sp. RU4T]